MLWFNNFFNASLVFSLAQYNTSYPSIWLKLLEKVVQLRILLFKWKKVGLSYEKFLEEKRGKISTYEYAMMI